jgi:ABC-type multidrug transport system fused ATPase/permease subunit
MKKSESFMKIISIIAILLLFWGCSSLPILDTPEVEDPAPVVKEVIDVNNETKAEIDSKTDETIKKADEIKEEARKIIDIVPPEVKPDVKPNIDSIDNKADEIKDLQISLKEQGKKLDEITDKLEITLVDIITITSQKEQLRAEKGELIKKLEEKEQELLKERDLKQQALFSKMIYLIIASVILGAICLVSAFRGDSKAIWGAVGAGVIIIVSLSISFYMTEFAIVGFIAIIGGLGLVAWNAYKDNINQKATEELVHTVEVAKDKLTPSDTEAIFGKHAMVGQAHLIQSPATVKRVQEVRKKRRDDWEPIVKKDE